MMISLRWGTVPARRDGRRPCGADDAHMRRLLSILGVLSVGSVVGIAVLVLVKAHSAPDYWPVAWPGVLTGCGTLALAGVTYRVLLGDQDDRRKRDRQDARRAEQKRRAQAAKVQTSEAKQTGGNGSRGEWFHNSYAVDVRNGSDDAIGEGTITFVIDPRDARLDNVDRPVVVVRRVLAGDSAQGTMTVKLRGDWDAAVSHRVLVWFTFRDAAGVLWARDPDHRLIEITGADATRLAFQAERGMTNDLDPDDEVADPSVAALPPPPTS
jgi:hypothetical protein